jgi:hypothetical protein
MKTIGARIWTALSIVLLAVVLCLISILRSGFSDDARMAALQAEGAMLQAKAAEREQIITALQSRASSSPSQEITSQARRRESLKVVLQMSRSFDRTLEIEHAAYDLARESMERAFQELGKLESRADRASFLRGMFTAAGQLPSPEAIQWIKKSPEQIYAMRALATAWLGGELPSSYYPGLSEAGRMAVELTENGRGDMDAAILWAKELLTVYERPRVLGRIAAAFNATDPSRALAIYGELEEKEHTAFLTSFANTFANVPYPGWREIGKWPESEPRTAALVALCEVFGKADDETAMMAFSEMPSGKGRDEAISSLARSWYMRNAQGAMDWANTLTDQDYVAAQEALRSLTSGDSK